MKNKACLLLFVFWSGTQLVNAQSSCEAYQLVTDSIYSKTSNVLEAKNQKYPIDVKNPMLDSNEISVKNDYILNVNFVRLFSDTDVSRWFANFIEEPKMRNLVLERDNVSLKEIARNCKWKNSSYCINFLPENIDTVNYDSLQNFENNANKLRNKKLSFSNILYTKDKKRAFLYFNLKFGRSRGEESIWAVELIEKSGKWKILKMKGITR